MRLKNRVEELEKMQEQLIKDNKTYKEIVRYNYERQHSVDPFIDRFVPVLKNRVDKIHEELLAFENSFEKYKERPAQNYDGLIKSLEERVEKQEETIKNLEDICRSLLAERMDSIIGNFNEIFERGLKDLFNSEPAKKCKKGAKSSAEKCKKCGETKKGEEKCSVVKKKSKKS